MVMTHADDIHAWIYKYLGDPIHHEPLEYEDYTIADDLTVQIHDDCAILIPVPGGEMPIHITHVDGHMFLSGHVRSLHNMPHTVTGSFMCNNCGLTSLQGGPTKVGGNYGCSSNMLTSLAGCPPIQGDLMFDDNLLTDLSSVPRASFAYGGKNPWKNFRHTPDHIGQVMVIITPQTPLLGLLSAQQISCIDENGEYKEQINQILNKYAGEGKRAILNCALELKKAGYGGNASW